MLTLLFFFFPLHLNVIFRKVSWFGVFDEGFLFGWLVFRCGFVFIISVKTEKSKFFYGGKILIIVLKC